MSTQVDTGRPFGGLPVPIAKSNEFEVEIHFEQKLRTIFVETASDDGTIRDDTQWECLMAMFLKNRVVSIDDIKKLESVKPSYPCSWQTLLQTITQAFGDKSIKDFDACITENKEQLENCRTWINMINVKQLSASEMY